MVSTERISTTELSSSDGEVHQLEKWQKFPQIIHDEHNIKGFFGPYRWLSNFSPATVVLDGVVYPSVELAYQASKRDPSERGFFESCTPAESIKFNQDNPPEFYTPNEWDEKRVEIMRQLLEQKFDPSLNPTNYQKLLATGNHYLEETNWWNDTFWGVNLQGEGSNNLGLLLMTTRALHTD